MTTENAYLANMARKIYLEHKVSFQGLCLLFPSQKAARTFCYYLGTWLKKPIWAPRTYLFSQFVQELHPATIPDHLALASHLYEVRKQFSHPPSSFFTFYPRGATFLHDIEELAEHCIDPIWIFKERTAAPHHNVDQSKEAQKCIDTFWQKAQTAHKRAKTTFLEGYATWLDIYEAFHKHLKAQELYYQGLHYQQVYKKLMQQKIKVPYNHIIAIGLHPLPPLQERILEKLQEVTKVDCYYDTDAYYMEDPKQEAGYYLRKYAQKAFLGKNLQPPFPSVLKSRQDEVHFFSSPTQLGQLELAQKHLHHLQEKNKIKSGEIAILLADPQLFVPLLHLLSKNTPLDIHLDYPFTNTPLYELLVQLCSFHLYYHQYPRGASPFLIEKLNGLFAHPYTTLPKKEQEILGKMLDDRRNYENETPLRLSSLWKHILAHDKLKHKPWDYLLDFLELLATEQQEEWASWEQLSLQRAIGLCQKLKKLPYSNDPQPFSKDFISFFKEQMQKLILHIKNRNKEGLKIIALQEAHCLDFPHILILSANEGVFPPIKCKASHIPISLRQAYQLPTIENVTMEYAYLTYRLLQHVQTISFFYHEAKNQEQQGEMSRFLLQLQHEAPFKIKKHSFLPLLSNPEKTAIIVPKKAEIIASLNLFLEKNTSKKLTPSAINDYLDCSLRFYFKHIAQLPEPTPTEPVISPLTFGVALHRIMELLYRDYLGKTLVKETLPLLLKRIPPLVDYVLNNLDQPPCHKGSKGFVRKILSKLIARIVQLDGEKTPFKVCGLEVGRKGKALNSSFLLDHKRQVHLGGIIDRVDQTGDLLEIIDYKTGEWQTKINHIKDLFRREDTSRNKVALQLFWYSWLYTRSSAVPSQIKNISVQPTVISTRTIFEKKPDTHFSIFCPETRQHVSIGDIKPYTSLFEKELRAALTQLFDPEESFQQTKETKHCRQCPFQSICNR